MSYLDVPAPDGIPAALWKAVHDQFSFALGLKDGTVFYFGSADLHGDWVHLNEVRANSIVPIESHSDGKPNPFIFERGVDVRLSEISWVADAPHGSKEPPIGNGSEPTEN